MEATYPGRREVLAAGSAALLVAPAAALADKRSPDVDLADIISRNTQARGGAASLDAVQHTHSSLVLTEGGHAVQGGYIASKRGYVRVDIFSGGKRIYSEGVDSEGGWKWNGDAASPSPEGEEGVKNLKRGIELNLFGLHRYEERGHRLRLIGRETVDAVSYHVVEVHMRDGSINNFYIGPSLWQIDRSRSERIFHPDLDPKKGWIESRFFDFRKVSGVVTSARAEEYDLIKKQVIQTTQNTGLTFNQPFDPAVFSRHFSRTGSLQDLGIPVDTYD